MEVSDRRPASHARSHFSRHSTSGVPAKLPDTPSHHCNIRTQTKLFIRSRPDLEAIINLHWPFLYPAPEDRAASGISVPPISTPKLWDKARSFYEKSGERCPRKEVYSIIINNRTALVVSPL